MKQLLFILSIFLAVGCTDKSEPERACKDRFAQYGTSIRSI